MRRTALLSILLFQIILFFQLSGNTNEIHRQAKSINDIIKSESNIKRKNEIVNIVNYIDNTYSNLYQNLKKGEKIKIFFDPAHGILKNGEWQGDVTWRQSTKGLPEEYYSIPLCREFYKLIQTNPLIDVVTTKDFEKVLKGETDEYKNIFFTKTIELAKENNCFLIISSHLNNISPLHKADGKLNVKGIHITCDRYGRQYLTNVTSQYKGFLTMYNKLDTTGFSYDVALNFKSNMLKNDMTVNNWDHGAVAYDRFTYFSHFPFSVIFESGFISNPDEEEMLTNPIHQKTIATAQYKAIINSIRNKFGVDISGKTPIPIKKQSTLMINILKETRIILYYVRIQQIQKAINLSIDFEKRYSKYTKEYQVSNIHPIKKDLINIRNYLRLARKYKKLKKYSTAKKYYRKAISICRKKPLYSPTKYTAQKEYYALLKPQSRNSNSSSSGLKDIGHPPHFKPLTTKIEKFSHKTPFLLVIEPGDSLFEAIEKSIHPSKKYHKIIYNTFKNPVIVKWKWKKYYSKKHKKYKWKKYKTIEKQNFRTGIYIVYFNKNLSLKSVKRISRVQFNSSKYQNYLYFKNSYLSENEKKRQL